LLRTSDAVSKAARGEQVMMSIVLFTIIYGFLAVVWLNVLNRKIKTGPEDELTEVERAPRRWNWIDTTVARAVPGGESMTDAHSD
jgi:cytochrome bd-type quinol oxidase subunit 1